MKFYQFGDKNNPVIMLLPGTCCYWRGNFGHVIDDLQKNFYVVCVSYDGFDETENSEFDSILLQTEKIEQYINESHGGKICAVYGCSLGGSFTGLLAARQKIKMDYCIIGGSDLDQSGRLAARLQTRLVAPLLYQVVHTGKFKIKFLQRRMDKKMESSGEYGRAFMNMLGGGIQDMGFVTKRSIANQFYSDLITPLPMNIDVPGTEIHIFYAMKMGEKYKERYLKHFSHPIIHELDMLHEELLVAYPKEWVTLIEKITLSI